jgi:hypothetical protein
MRAKEGRRRHPGWRQARENWLRSRRAERQYGVQLRHIARQIGIIVRGLFRPDDPTDPGWSAITEALRAYERLIEPWARATATRMIADVAQTRRRGTGSASRSTGPCAGQSALPSRKLHG